jgi:hypothetical protein
MVAALWGVVIGPSNDMSLVPEQNLSIEILADDGILGGGFENVSDEFERLLGAAYHGAIKKFLMHVSTTRGFPTAW